MYFSLGLPFAFSPFFLAVVVIDFIGNQENNLAKRKGELNSN
nr:MAG TPA: hypothetical protein [Caudoviricetes sp.]